MGLEPASALLTLTQTLNASPPLYLVGAGFVIALIVVACTVNVYSKPLPGSLCREGTFQSEDPVGKDSVHERERDFSRIVNTQRDLWMFTAALQTPGNVFGSDVLGGIVDETNCQNRLKWWLQQELGRIPGAIDLGLTSQWQVVDRIIYFISATPSFNFVMSHRVLPMLLQAKFLLLVSASGQVRVAWYAFASDVATPGATSGPYVIKLVSENLQAERETGRTHTEFCYTATATGVKDMEIYIGKHVSLIKRGIANDEWAPYLKA